MKEGVFIGLDVGSVSVNCAILSVDGKILDDSYTRTRGEPVQTVARVLGGILKVTPIGKVRGLAVTGSGGKIIAELLGIEFVNEIIAQAKSVGALHPEVRTVIDIGGEDSKLICLRFDSSLGSMVIEDFAMNTICAAGTGSFLDQQASRLGLTIEEFSELALRANSTPRVAGRCSVFAKTDMIHLQQEATPEPDIVAGLCHALARNFRSNIGKGKTMRSPIAFHGGVAKNLGMVRAFEEVLGLPRGGLLVHRYHASMGAIGAALTSLENQDDETQGLRGLEALEDYTSSIGRDRSFGLKPLSGQRLKRQGLGKGWSLGIRPERPINAYLGIDVGSISTNVAVLDEKKNLLARCYLLTAGRPIEAVRRGIEEVADEVGDLVNIVGVGTTGSGRYLIGDFVGADVVKNEITAQARAAVEIDPSCDTIFEIGGQDSKFISLANGVVVDFEMNKVCAAGTGSFLEEQAEKLGIKINDEFGKLALSSSSPVGLGERCTVFMESNLIHHQQLGTRKDDLVAGLSYSIVHNYLNRVVGSKRIGDNIFFQGAVAFNQGVVAAFENVLGKPITVPPHNDVTGAIGVALVAMEEGSGESNFRGFEAITRSKYELSSFECHDCPNRCEVKEVRREFGPPLFYGSRCEKYDVERKKTPKDEIPDLFAERENLLLKDYNPKGKKLEPLARVGIPRILLFHELYPFWKAFFEALGFECVLSDRTNKQIIHQGLESVVAETCFPIKVAHGHVLNLLEKGIDWLFLPTIINMDQPSPRQQQSFNCPYVQTISHMVRAAIDVEAGGVKLLSPLIAFGWGRRLARAMLWQVGRALGRGLPKIVSAIRAAELAQERFYIELRGRGREVLSSLQARDRACVIITRPYNGCDPGINLNLPKKLRDLGALPIPIDYLDFDSVDLSRDSPDMYWRYGRKILAAARVIREDPRLNAIYVTNFGCGPDSFIIRFFREEMQGKPYLQIEVDEHSADVGAITRCEAFLDSLRNGRVEEKERSKFFIREAKLANRTIYIPHMGDHAFALRAAFLASGIPAEVFPESDEETLEWGRKFTLGKECYPCILTTGDMVRIVKSTGFESEKSAFFMPSTNGPCRFGQYNRLQRMVLDELGYQDVPIISPNQGKDFYKGLGAYGRDFIRWAWCGIVSVDILDRWLRRIRPYEREPGATEEVYRDCLGKVCQAIAEGRDLIGTMKWVKASFERIERDPTHDKPRIGVVGEIFVRANQFANDYIVRQIEELGGEVELPPIREWLYHVNRVVKLTSLVRLRPIDWLKTFIVGFFQKLDEARLLESIDHFPEDRVGEPTIKQIWRYSQPYLPPWFGEAALSLGNAVHYVEEGISGIVNVMPFTCLPGNIATACLKRFKEEHNDIPCLVMAYDGLEQTNARTRLEAFMHQARQWHRFSLDKNRDRV